MIIHNSNHVKWSPILHGISATTGIVGMLALIGVWFARDATFFGQTQAHLFNDAQTLLLASIAFG